MSYDLNFWRYKPGISLDHQKTYELLSKGQMVDGLEDIPIDEMKKRVAEEFTKKGWEQFGKNGWESKKGTFQIFTTSQFFRVDCYGMQGEDMNIFLDVAHEFSCRLYDPQARKRYGD